MKKFDRLPPEQRKAEIQSAALHLFNEKGFASTTMENIVEQVSLSKGGVYRLYPSTIAILSDLMVEGMRLRNAEYEDRVRQETEQGQTLTVQFLIEMIADSLLLYPEISSVYVEFLWEKQRRPELETLYREICSETVEETASLMKKYGADDVLISGSVSLERLTELMNAAILSLRVLNLNQFFAENKEQICSSLLNLLKI